MSPSREPEPELPVVSAGPVTPGPVALASLDDPAAVLFDLDGTLVDTVALRVRAWQLAFRRFGIEVAAEELGVYMGSDGRWLAGEVARQAGHDLDWAARDETDRLSGAFFDELNVAPVPLPAARELLVALEAGRITWAIVTSSQPGQVQTSVRALQLPVPPRIVDGGHVEHAKPEPDLLLAAASQLGVAPERCWYVGDSTWDMMASHRAGMPGIAVPTGAVSAADLLVAGASVAIAGLDELHREMVRRGLLG